MGGVRGVDRGRTGGGGGGQSWLRTLLNRGLSDCGLCLTIIVKINGLTSQSGL
jgi:hypothetical protein